jgi:hypothetical protein
MTSERDGDQRSHSKGFFDFFILHPVATGLIMSGIFLIGAVCYPFMPVSALPHPHLSDLHQRPDRQQRGVERRRGRLPKWRPGAYPRHRTSC